MNKNTRGINGPKHHYKFIIKEFLHVFSNKILVN